MLKATHQKIVEIIFHHLNPEMQNSIDLPSFVKGSKHPDNNLGHRLKIHDAMGSLNLVMRLTNELMTLKHNPEDMGFKLGVIAHYMTDYCCAYHSNKKYIGRHLTHRIYEKKIHRFAENLDTLVDGPVFTSLLTSAEELDFYLTYNHSPDVFAEPKRDLYHAISLCNSYIHLILEEHQKQSKINFSCHDNLERVLIFSDTYYPHINGVSNTLNEYLSFLKATRQPYLLVIPKYKHPIWQNELGYRIEKVSAIKFPFYPQAVISFPSKRRLDHIIAAFQPSIIHVMTEFTLGFYGMRYGKKHDIPVMTNYSSYFHMGLKHYRLGFMTRPLNRYLKWFHGQADMTTCPSKITKNYLIEEGISPVNVFTRGVNRQRFSPSFRSEALREKWQAKDKTVCLYTGRISGEKDIIVLLMAYQKMSEDIKAKTKLVICGDGPLLKQLKNDYHDVTFTGFKTGRELSEIYASSDIYVFPSPSETFGNVVLEAMASGLPCIVVDKGGVLDTVKHRVNGLIVPQKEIIEFRDAMMLLVIDAQLRQYLANQALAYAIKRDWHRVFDRLVYDYAKVIQNYRFKQMNGFEYSLGDMTTLTGGK